MSHEESDEWRPWPSGHGTTKRGGVYYIRVVVDDHVSFEKDKIQAVCEVINATREKVGCMLVMDEEHLIPAKEALKAAMRAAKRSEQ